MRVRRLGWRDREISWDTKCVVIGVISLVLLAMSYTSRHRKTSIARAFTHHRASYYHTRLKGDYNLERLTDRVISSFVEL